MKLYLCPIAISEEDLLNKAFPKEFLMVDRLAYGQLTRWLHHQKEDEKLIIDRWNLVIFDEDGSKSMAALWLSSKKPRWAELSSFIEKETEVWALESFKGAIEKLPPTWPELKFCEELNEF